VLKAFLAIVAVLLVSLWAFFVRMPGRSFRGPLPPLTAEQTSLRDELARDVRKLGSEIGERNLINFAQLNAAAEFVEQSFVAAGLQPKRDTYDVSGRACHNIVAEIPGTSSEIVLIGAHYDSVPGAPGANDNGSGTAGVLALARRFAGKAATRTLRFVAFTNEEPWHFQQATMGSLIYAKRCRAAGDRIVAMLSLETIGYFSQEPHSQEYPVPALAYIYPTRGNFIAFVGDTASRDVVRQAIGSFRQHAQFPSEGAALPSSIPGIGWSDQWSFWQQGYPALMVTDTAPFRYPHYHKLTDTPDKLNYDSLARVVAGLEYVVADLARE
jgi:Zn-dependent M28 family amino/carboxypeptidase